MKSLDFTETWRHQHPGTMTCSKCILFIATCLFFNGKVAVAS
jgi:hypothetical protein